MLAVVFSSHPSFLKDWAHFPLCGSSGHTVQADLPFQISVIRVSSRTLSFLREVTCENILIGIFHLLGHVQGVMCHGVRMTVTLVPVLIDRARPRQLNVVVAADQRAGIHW